MTPTQSPHGAGEAAGTVAVLPDETRFALMRAYRTFTHHDHRTYLRHTEQLLRSLGARGLHTRVALFDPVDYGLFCRKEHLAADDPASRTRYTAEVAAHGVTLPYEGGPLHRLVPLLLDARAAQHTREEAGLVLSGAGTCRRCGTDLSSMAFGRAAAALALVLEAVGHGMHHLVCSVAAGRKPLLAALDARRRPGSTYRVAEPAALALTTVLAAGIATRSPGGIVLRTVRPRLRDTLRGWRLAEDWIRPLTAAEVFTAYCTDTTTGALTGPEPGARHLAGIPVPHPAGAAHC